MKDQKRVVTFPQQGERQADGTKLPRCERHKNLKSIYRMFGKSTKPWECRIHKVL